MEEVNHVYQVSFVSIPKRVLEALKLGKMDRPNIAVQFQSLKGF